MRVILELVGMVNRRCLDWLIEDLEAFSKEFWALMLWLRTLNPGIGRTVAGIVQALMEVEALEK